MKIFLFMLMMSIIGLTGCDTQHHDKKFIAMNGTRYLMSMPVNFVEDHSVYPTAGFYKIDFSKFSSNNQMTDSSFEIIDLGEFENMKIKYVKDNIDNKRALGFYLFIDQDNQLIPSGSMMYKASNNKIIGVLKDGDSTYDLDKMSTLDLLKLANKIEMMAKSKQQ